MTEIIDYSKGIKLLKFQVPMQEFNNRDKYIQRKIEESGYNIPSEALVVLHGDITEMRLFCRVFWSDKDLKMEFPIADDQNIRTLAEL